MSTDEPESLTWLVRTGSHVVGWVKLCRPHQHVGLLRELHLSESLRNPMIVAARLCSSIYEYSRDHGLLKLKIHRDCVHDCLHAALAHAGFSHDDPGHGERVTQVYVDLYRSPRSKPTLEPAEQPPASEIRMAS